MLIFQDPNSKQPKEEMYLPKNPMYCTLSCNTLCTYLINLKSKIANIYLPSKAFLVSRLHGQNK